MIAGLDLLMQVHRRAVHLSSDGRSWRKTGDGFCEVTDDLCVLQAHLLVEARRNADGWWALWRPTAAGAALLRPRAPGRFQGGGLAPTPVDVPRVIELYDAGMSIARIRQTMRVPREQIRRALLANNREIRQPGRPPVTERTAS